MQNIAKSIQNNNLNALATRAPEHVLQAIRKASAKSGVNFAYMVQQASAESSFDPKAKAKTSSASGLYQFIESTWMQMVKKHGHKYGMGDMADQISARGKVMDKMMRKEILKLRNDPEMAAAMAAELASDNKEFLENNWGGDVGSTELYFAHFLGAGGAASFMKSKDKNPLQPAALLFPDAAKSNRNVFYDKGGRMKTLAEVYNHFDKKFDIKTQEMPMLASQDAPAQSKAFTSERNMRMIQSAPPSGGLLVSYQNLIASPVELMLLSQMDLPSRDDESHNGGWTRRNSMFNS